MFYEKIPNVKIYKIQKKKKNSIVFYVKFKYYRIKQTKWRLKESETE